MDSVKVDRTYGFALFQATEDFNNTNEIAKGLTQLVSVIEDNLEFFDMLKSPAIPKDEKKSSVQKIFQGQMDEVLINFLCVLIDKGRIDRFFGIAKEFDKCVDEFNGITVGIVYSVVEIPKEKLKKLEAETGALIKKNVELKNEIEPELIGGIKIYVDGKLIDASLKRRLLDMKEQLI
jgi:ATP synthase F1 delta subunit